MLASWTDFMIAELELVGGNEPASKAAMFRGIEKSMNKVISFKTPQIDLLVLWISTLEV